MKKYMILLCLIFSHHLLLAQEHAQSQTQEIAPSVETTDSSKDIYRTIYYCATLLGGKPEAEECYTCFYENITNPTGKYIYAATVGGIFFFDRIMSPENRAYVRFLSGIFFFCYDLFLDHVLEQMDIRASTTACRTCWKRIPPNEPSSI